ncbi:RsiV family protein [Salinicola aestuarinus]|uniref:RsiV family protein n=1 Tax=Salinicola aestuarinus TaxID=1949082 RepID=UPI000DA20ED8|nr:RsiV family protein [Salinicola aestuarinus]
MQGRCALGALGLVSLLLAGCQSLGDREGNDALRTEPVVKSAHEPGCSGDGCATVEADYLRFPASPALSADLERRLFGLAGGISDSADGGAPSFDAFAGRVFAAASREPRRTDGVPSYVADLGAQVVADNRHARVIQLDGYLFSGGAHGLPLTDYMVIDRDTLTVVSLDDMLLPGQHPAYERALARAHQRWMDGDDIMVNEANWPLSTSGNAAPLAEGLSVKYQVYELGPYAIGQPTLTIPYSELGGVIKPRYLP